MQVSPLFFQLKIATCQQFFFFLSVHSLFSSFMTTFISCFTLLHLQKKLGNFWLPRKTSMQSFMPQPSFQTVSVLNKLSERNGVCCEIRILLSIHFYATDSAYCNSSLVNKMYRLNRAKKEKQRMLSEAALMFRKSQNTCLLIINETFKSHFWGSQHPK